MHLFLVLGIHLLLMYMYDDVKIKIINYVNTWEFFSVPLENNICYLGMNMHRMKELKLFLKLCHYISLYSLLLSSKNLIWETSVLAQNYYLYSAAISE